MDNVEPEFFSQCRVVAEPRFEVAVRGLPVLPDNSAGFDSAGIGAKIINIKWF